jgi:ABC-type transport system involved in cytochrome c biogenesis permease subunit
MIFPLGYAALAFYAASFGCYTAFLYSTHRWVGRLATALLASGIVLQYFALYERSRWTHAVPYNDLYGSMSLFAWLLGVTYLALETYHRQRSVGAFATLLLLLWISGVMAFAPSTPSASPPARGPLFAFHVTLNTLAYAAFALSFALSLIYLIQARVLRARRPGMVFWRFPALDLLERMSRSSVWVGLISLCIGVPMGFIFERRLIGHFDVADPKVIVTFVIVGLYAAYLWLARLSDWRGPRAALVCAFNFLLVIFSYTFVNLYFTRFHKFN